MSGRFRLAAANTIICSAPVGSEANNAATVITTMLADWRTDLFPIQIARINFNFGNGLHFTIPKCVKKAVPAPCVAGDADLVHKEEDGI